MEDLIWSGGSRQQALAVESAFAELLGKRYVRSRPERGYDFESADGSHLLDLRFSLQGSRDLDAALFHLASVMVQRGDVKRAILIARLPRMTAERVEQEWHRLQTVLRPNVGRRLGVVAVTADRDITIPEDDDELQALMVAARDAFGRAKSAVDGDPLFAPWTAKMFEVWRVLLDAWLRKEPPLPVATIMGRSGCSRPTVAATLDRLQRTGELHRTSNRSAVLSSMPRRSLGEILTLADGFRKTIRFVDGSGRRQDPAGLLRRIVKKKPPNVALGGVVAARHYSPNFDLNGLPRVDITIHGPELQLTWLDEVDPGLSLIGIEGSFTPEALKRTYEHYPTLRMASPEERSPVLVAHRLFRPAALFDAPSDGGLPLASPTDVLLDLYDLRLASQVEDIVETLRKREANG